MKSCANRAIQIESILKIIFLRVPLTSSSILTWILAVIVFCFIFSLVCMGFTLPTSTVRWTGKTYGIVKTWHRQVDSVKPCTNATGYILYEIIFKFKTYVLPKHESIRISFRSISTFCHFLLSFANRFFSILFFSFYSSLLDKNAIYAWKGEAKPTTKIYIIFGIHLDRAGNKCDNHQLQCGSLWWIPFTNKHLDLDTCEETPSQMM